MRNQKSRQSSSVPVSYTHLIALIAAGICAIVSLFYPQFDIIAVLKLAPAVLIFLGLEILINYFFHREDTLKYDFLSGFVCFLLICASVGAVAIPPIWKQYRCV